MTYVDTARRCMLRLFELRSPYDMVGKHLHIKTMQWTELDSCFGRNGDSKEMSMWKMYNLLTGANKSSYIDSFLDRSLNAGEISNGICRALRGENEYSWFIR